MAKDTKKDPAAPLVKYLERTGKGAHEPVTWSDLIAAARFVPGDEQ
jgi:hypothetical protein